MDKLQDYAIFNLESRNGFQELVRLKSFVLLNLGKFQVRQLCIPNKIIKRSVDIIYLKKFISKEVAFQ